MNYIKNKKNNQNSLKTLNLQRNYPLKKISILLFFVLNLLLINR